MFRRKSLSADAAGDPFDVVLVGGGIMSATLGALLAQLAPEWSIVVYERLGGLAEESSNPWNNAGTGHAGLCELNYMPDSRDGSRAADAGRKFAMSREFWNSMAPEIGSDFLNTTPHMSVVFGDRDVTYLRERFATMETLLLRTAPMEYTEDPAKIAEWAPLLMRGRRSHEPMAATRAESGTDVDFGELTHALVRTMRRVQVRTRHEVRDLSRGDDGIWTVRGRDLSTDSTFVVRSRFVFVGAGGYALKLLQKARIPEVRGYAVFPFGAQFFRTGNPDVVGKHDAKVYGQAALGAPPMSVPHLDKRVVSGASSIMFGPYATFDTKLLKHGRVTDLFTTIRPRNVPVLLAVGARNPSLVRYLVGQVLSSRRRKFAELCRFVPDADPADWELIRAGQRAQVVKPDRREVGVLTFGTELVTGADGTIAGLLGASPGASTAPSIMVDLLARCFPERRAEWTPVLRNLMPSLDGESGTHV
ncbi:malate dehydrogenase (quinone) [Rhodococcus sp. NPDC058521]|uniref:malate dehydrogenase (quinone) n=1 Tax=Rhodococcus sp. NPDC058521 TaxID=3346536 RepID=UPI00365A9A71